MQSALDWFDSLWFVWWGIFVVFEGIGLWYEHTSHGNDENTLTHVICVVLPRPYRFFIIVWLFLHFVIQHTGRS